eukprot:CAMPEP_0170215466 /NCGR_PEP_ID=MMETSP0116_2-20130129/7370_1 /TAXON_ID=400756 /ORGANISM="Durinskia baltica, Strain CSIRO CS-38" /LENGTH=186 /DNA_ID=CAMNT_0010466043 /DNA_START=32 /DNA_END=590 /DNA_ORIENTATION=+
MKLALLLASITSASAFLSPSPSGGVVTRLAAEAVEANGETTMMGGAAISALTKDVKTVYTTEDVDKFLPHRYPFALVDKIVEYEAGKKAVGIKQVTKNEEFFNGHFPGKPIMPGVLQLEAMAQLAGCVMDGLDGAEPGAIFFFGGADGVKWKKPVVPGDTLVMEVEVLKFNKKFGICKATGKAYVD